MAPAAASQGSQQGCSLTLPPSAQAPSSAAGRAQGCSSSRDFPSGWPLLPVPLLQGLGDKRGCTEQLPLTSPGLGRKGRNPSFLGEKDFSWQHHQPPGASVTHGAAPNLCSDLELPWVGGELQLLFPPSLTLQLCPDPFHPGHCSLFFLLFLLNPGRGRYSLSQHGKCSGSSIPLPFPAAVQGVGAAGSSRTWESIQSANQGVQGSSCPDPNPCWIHLCPSSSSHQEGFPCISPG